MEPKFTLPSPNFNKSKEASKSNLHYLTPCGMTLLPRTKQPPPMYGARGSTVPAKYLKQEQPQQNSKQSEPIAISDSAPIYTPPSRVEFCANCGMQLASTQDMRRHLEQHEPCPADACDFAALPNILERHIEANHITGLYQTVKRVWTPEDIAKWRAERRKRFPTAENVEAAKRAKEQRLKRGERLEASKSRFGKPEDRRRTRPQSNTKEHPRHAKRQKNNAKKSVGKRDGPQTQTNTKEKVTPASENLPTVSSTGVPMFRGTSQMEDFKHVEKQDKSQVNALTSMLGMYGTDSEDEENELATDKDELNINIIKDTPTLEIIEDPSPSLSGLPLHPQALLENTKPNEFSKAGDSSSDEAPEEQPIERKTEDASAISTTQQEIVAAAVAVKPKPKTVVKRLAPKKRFYGLNYKRARQMTKQNTMLSKLLTSDIRHERNILLQCVRYVCEEKYFGIGASQNMSSNLTLNCENNIETIKDKNI